MVERSRVPARFHQRGTPESKHFVFSAAPRDYSNSENVRTFYRPDLLDVVKPKNAL